MVRRAGATLALLGFAVSTLVGLSAGNPPVVVLQRALSTLVACLFVGLVGGWVAERIVEEHVRHKEKTLFDAMPPEVEDTLETDDAEDEDTLVVTGAEAAEATAT